MRYVADWWFLQWDSVKAVASNDLSRVVGAIPLAGYLILFNDELIGLATFNSLAGVDDPSFSPFWLSGLAKLRMVFFGSLFVFISFLIFKVFRPRVLDVARNDLDFSEHVRESYTVHELQEMEGDVHSDRWKPRLETFWEMLGKIRSKTAVVSGYRPDVRQQMFAAHDHYIRFLSREWWVGMMHVHRTARIASLSFGVSGYLMLAVPLLDLSQAVLRDLLSHS